MPGSGSGSGTGRPCKRCKAEDAPFVLRKAPICSNCYIQYVSSKTVKRLGKLHGDTRVSREPTARRYLAGLSFGPSSSVLAQLLDDNAHRYSINKGSSPFEPVIVHIDTDLSTSTGPDEQSPAQKLVAQYQERFPYAAFEYVPLVQVLEVKSVDWSTLPLGEEVADPTMRLRGLFEKLPSLSSRADVLRLLIRHLLLHLAVSRSCSALLLGNNTTSLAALTLSEVASGRGLAVPWQVNDGLCTVCKRGDDNIIVEQFEFPIYYPLREIMRNELIHYISLIPALSDVVSKEQLSTVSRSSVVSYKDQSIAEVMARYFQEVEETHLGVVANVVRTAGKLNRVTADGFCGSCGMTLDELGDSRWAGEIGEEDGRLDTSATGDKLCYGCKRSLHG